MSSLDISLESPGTPGAFFYVGGEGGASSKPEGRPVARRAALRKRRAPLRAGLRLKREPRPSVCGEVAPAQAASLSSDADTNFPEPTPCSHVWRRTRCDRASRSADYSNGGPKKDGKLLGRRWLRRMNRIF